MKISKAGVNKLLEVIKTVKKHPDMLCVRYSFPINMNAWKTKNGSWQWAAINKKQGTQYDSPDKLIIAKLKEKGWDIYD